MSNISPAHISPARILVVDDDPLFIKALCNTLRDDGHFVATANDGQAGIDTFKSALNTQEPFAIVLTDLGMHPVDGRQVATTIKDASPSTVVILLTGWGEWFETKGGIPLPVDGILGKPPKLSELRDTLTRFLGTSGI
jgi:DNA-binding response OmpR family regulator